MRRVTPALLACIALLVGCAGVAKVPELTYYRLPPPSVSVPSVRPLDAPLVVETFEADGLYGETALLYALDPEGVRLRAYHYQRWADPPTRMLQRRLIQVLQAAQVAPLVTSRLPARERQYRLRLRIEALERLPRGDERWAVRVGLHARLEASDASRPLFERMFRHELDSPGPRVRDAVEAFAKAIDAVYADLLRDLDRLPRS